MAFEDRVLSPRIEILFVSLPCDCPSAVQRRKKIGGRNRSPEREFPFSTAARWRCYSAMLWLSEAASRFNSELRFDPTSAASRFRIWVLEEPRRISPEGSASPRHRSGRWARPFPDEREEEVVEAEIKRHHTHIDACHDSDTHRLFRTMGHPVARIEVFDPSQSETTNPGSSTRP